MSDLKIVYLSPDDLKPYEGNARKHGPNDIDQIIDSIEKTGGFNDPVGIWGGTTSSLRDTAGSSPPRQCTSSESHASAWIT